MTKSTKFQQSLLALLPEKIENTWHPTIGSEPLTEYEKGKNKAIAEMEAKILKIQLGYKTIKYLIYKELKQLKHDQGIDFKALGKSGKIAQAICTEAECKENNG